VAERGNSMALEKVVLLSVRPEYARQILNSFVNIAGELNKNNKGE